MFEELLHTAERAALAGKTGAALALLRALTRQFPHEERGWRALAELSDNDEERQEARARARALEPSGALGELAQVEVASAEPPEEERRGGVAPWALYAVALVLLLAVTIPLFRLWRSGEGGAATDTSPVITCGLNCTAVPTTANEAAATEGLPTIPVAPSATSIPTPQPTAALPPTPQPTLATGAFVQRDGWGASLLRPDYSLFLDGQLGDQKPRGRFLLILLALANGGGAPQPFPANLLVLHDGQGRSYTPAPGLSTAYLAAFGRGQRGDLSLENPLPAGGGLYSVPVIYDLPTDASGLQLSLGDAGSRAWPINP